MVDLSLLGHTPSFAFFICLLAVLAVAISKSGFGGAMGALSAPIMLFAFPPTIALAILIPLFILIDIWVVWHWRRDGVRRLIIWMVVFGTIGQIIGWLLIRGGTIDDELILFFIGLIAVITALRFFWQQASSTMTASKLRLQIRQYRSRAISRASIWCSLSGFTSFVSLTGGIPVQIYLLPLQLPRQLFVATMAWYFLFINLFKLPFFIDLQLLTTSSLTISALMVPFVPIGVFIGRWMNKRLSDKLFYYIAYSSLLLLGLRLLYRYFGGDL